MRLSTLSSSFIFQFPSDFLPPTVLNDYRGFLEKYKMPYENIIDYLNSTIKSVSFPGLAVNLPSQTIIRGKKISYKPATPVQDIVASHEITVTFRDVDGHANYMLMYDIFQKHYLDTQNLFIQPLTITSLDMWRNSVYQIRFYQLIAMNLSECLFDYSVQKINPAEFSVTFNFNFIELDFLLNKTKIVDLANPSVLGNSNPNVVPIILNNT
jgi:hypothetical protein